MNKSQLAEGRIATGSDVDNELRLLSRGALLGGVEMIIADHPLHRSGRAALPHPAPTSGGDAQALRGIGMTDAGGREPDLE